jgi:hypothetical protein
MWQGRLCHFMTKAYRFATSTRQLMPRWRGSHLGAVEAKDKKSAIAEAAKEFNTTPARQNNIVVTKLDPNR